MTSTAEKFAQNFTFKDDTGIIEYEFPILSETVLGDSPYIRMIKDKHAEQCQTCTRPYTVFRWKPGPHERMRKTVICPLCAIQRNVCQSSLLDLTYDLPVRVRDAMLRRGIEPEKTGANLEFHMNQIQERMIAEGMSALKDNPIHGTSADALDLLTRKGELNDQRLPAVCSDWIRGTCSRGSRCSFRHYFLPNDNNSSSSSSLYSNNGSFLNLKSQTQRPSDQSIRTLLLTGVPPSMTYQTIRTALIGFGSIAAVKVFPEAASAFVTFDARNDAENAVDTLKGVLNVEGVDVGIFWAQPAPKRSSLSSSSSLTASMAVAMAMDASSAAKRGRGAGRGHGRGRGRGLGRGRGGNHSSVPPPPGSGSFMYPSMRDQLGASVPSQEGRPASRHSH